MIHLSPGVLPWGGKHFLVPSSPFRWLGSTGRRRCTPHCAQTVCEHKNRKPLCMAFKNLKAVVPILLILPLTWYSRSDTESCLLYCSRWCQCPPAGLGSRSIWGSECASSIPWRKAGSGQRSSPHILHMTWGLVVRLALGCSPCWPHWHLSMQQCDNWWSRWQKNTQSDCPK